MSKLKLQDFVKYGKLFSCYGKLLSEDRQKIMTDYFEYNMTLVEIATERGISRQAVLDCIDKSCQKLEYYENILQFVNLKDKLVKELENLKSESDLIVKQKVDKLLEKL